jgi:formate hydrogenlyase subunit 3/multisubunit Na+/H+ antiporter MnhD subunit
VTLFFAGMALILAGGVAALVVPHDLGGRLYRTLVTGGCIAAIAAAAQVLASGVARTAVMPVNVPGGDWHVGIDQLSAVFLVAALAVGAMCALF